MQASKVAVGPCTCRLGFPAACSKYTACRGRSSPQSRNLSVLAYPGEDAVDVVETVLSLPLFPLPSVLHPAQLGELVVFEPKYLSLFRDLQSLTAPGSEPKFGHILAASSAPPALMQDSVGGLPNMGVCAAVKSVQQLDNGRLLVKYQGSRRFKLLAVDKDEKPYPIAAATWIDDQSNDTNEQQADMTAKLERDVYTLLQQVVKYSQLLSAEVSSSTKARQQALLPDPVLLYAPPPPMDSKQKGVADYMIKAGGVAGAKIATWQRMGSVYGNTGARKKTVQDPYQMARDQLAGRRRQELFSFAAAQMLELGMPERLALLECRDTSARLQFVAAAVQPYLADLLARVSVKQAMPS